MLAALETGPLSPCLPYCMAAVGQCHPAVTTGMVPQHARWSLIPVNISSKSSVVLAFLLVLLLVRLLAGAPEISSPPVCQLPASPAQWRALL